MSGVELVNVQKIFPDGCVAVRDTNLKINEGEFVILVGPSGCGKSTLLRMIAGLEEVTSGEIRIGGRTVNEVAAKDRNISMVFQHYALYPHMTVRQNMGFALKQARMRKVEIAKRIAHAAEMLGLEKLLERKPKQLSGGQRQRVALGRSIVRDAEVFLFDEPLSNLDASLRTRMRTEIAKLHRHLGKTMIYVTHDQVEAMTMADRIVVIKNGELLQFDSPLEIYRRPANEFVAGFIGSPSMNLISGRIESAARVEKTVLFVDESDTLRFNVPRNVVSRFDLPVGKRVKLGVRPEDIYLDSAGLQGRALTRLSLTIEVLEPIGNEVIVHSGLGNGCNAKIVSRGRLEELPVVGSLKTFHVDLSNASFFDRTSGDSLFLN